MIRVDQDDFIQFINDQLDIVAQEDQQDNNDTDVTIGDIIQAFINNCGSEGRLPTLEEAQTIVLLESIIRR